MTLSARNSFTIFLGLALGTQTVASSTPLRFCHLAWKVSYPFTDRGPDFELAEAFASKIGVNPEYVLIDWKSIFEEAQGESKLFKENSCDLYAISMTVKKERLELFHIESFYSGRTLIIVRQNDHDIKTISNLGGRKTAVVENTTYEEWLKATNRTALKDNPISITSIPSGNTMGITTSKLEAGEVDFVLLDTAVALHLVKKHPEKFRIAFPVGPNEKVGWGFRSDRDQLALQFRKFIKEGRESKESSLNKVYLKYYGISYRDFEHVVSFSEPLNFTR